MSLSNEVLFEFIQAGNSIKVVAYDVNTGCEVAIIGPRSAPQKRLEQVAMMKLKYVLEKDF